ncbi:MAG: hypothetical protein F6K42_18390 [Leptolyngbya sp. SIO1D8]|nr:hypothetical protein [Leptolyngbya sp. SIO1D8]
MALSRDRLYPILSLIMGGFLASGCLPGLLNNSLTQRDAALTAAAKNYLRAMNRSQEAHYLTHGSFAQTLDELQLVISKEIDGYRLEIITVDDQKVVMTGQAQAENLPHFGAAVFVDESAMATRILCQSEGASAAPPIPQLEGATPTCPSGSENLDAP